MPTSIPRNFMPAMFRPRGIIQAGRTDLTRLWSAKIQTISLRWPAFRQPRVDNQRKDKRVESYLVRCLDGGSSPPISTDKKMAFQLCWGPFSYLWRHALAGQALPLLNPSQLRWQPLSGACGLRLRLRPVATLLQLPGGSLADAPPRRLMPPTGFALKSYPHFVPHFLGRFRTRT